MELFKDKGVLELTKELTKELRTRSIEDKEMVLCQDLVQVKMRFSSS